MMTPNVSTKVDAFTLREPLGVVAAITPFNFPVMVPMWIYPIAMACGNTIVLSRPPTRRAPPSSRPSCGRRPACPDGVFNVVYGGREAVKAIVEHPDIKAIQFVGSTAVGRYVYEEGTKRGKRVGSYTSAKNAMLVLPDADMDLVADAAVAAGFGSAGERCMAQTLMIAVGDTAERLARCMLERIARLKIGPGMEPGMDMGPIYSAEHRESVINWIDIGEAEGAELLVDGRTFEHPDNPDGFFLGVTLFDHVTPEMKIYQEEIFGPVLGIVYAETFDEALELINDHKYANGTAIFTTDGGAARRFKLEVDVPMIGVNVPDPGAGRLPVLRRAPRSPRSATWRCAVRTASASSPSRRWSPSAGRSPASRGRPEPRLPRQQLDLRIRRRREPSPDGFRSTRRGPSAAEGPLHPVRAAGQADGDGLRRPARRRLLPLPSAHRSSRGSRGRRGRSRLLAALGDGDRGLLPRRAHRIAVDSFRPPR